MPLNPFYFIVVESRPELSLRLSLRTPPDPDLRKTVDLNSPRGTSLPVSSPLSPLLLTAQQCRKLMLQNVRFRMSLISWLSFGPPLVLTLLLSFCGFPAPLSPFFRPQTPPIRLFLAPFEKSLWPPLPLRFFGPLLTTLFPFPKSWIFSPLCWKRDCLLPWESRTVVSKIFTILSVQDLPWSATSLISLFL